VFWPNRTANVLKWDNWSGLKSIVSCIKCPLTNRREKYIDIKNVFDPIEPNNRYPILK
jgi:hypothetical protein